MLATDALATTDALDEQETAVIKDRFSSFLTGKSTTAWPSNREPGPEYTLHDDHSSHLDVGGPN